MIRRLALLACIFTLCITAASSFIRNTQAGLGCSPWPQCLERQGEARAGGGVLRMAPAAGASGEVDAVFVARALHRISAVLVGLLALGIALFGWSRFGASDRAAAALALVVTVFLSWLGRYTPHDLPLVTIGNVLGGFALAATFGWIAAGGTRVRRAASSMRPRPLGGAGPGATGGSGSVAGPGARAVLAWIALALAGLQSALGVTIGARDAVGACVRPLCLPQAAVDPAVFDPRVAQAIASAADGQALHLAHRLLAIAVAAFVLLLVLRPASGDPGTAGGLRLPALGALACIVLLAPLGLATASGLLGPEGGTLHNVLAGTCFILLAVAARHASYRVGIDSH